MKIERRKRIYMYLLSITIVLCSAYSVYNYPHIRTQTELPEQRVHVVQNIPPHNDITRDTHFPHKETESVQKTERTQDVHTYIAVSEGCGPHFEGACLNVRSDTSTNTPAVFKLRSGIVLKASQPIEYAGRMWYKILFDEWVRYPERITHDWFVAGEYVEAFEDIGPQTLDASSTPLLTSKRIIVDRSEQKLYAFDGDTLFMEETVSTGTDLNPTPRGVFTIFHKTPSRYMQGPLPGISEDYYDLPGVPWNLYFTKEGGAIHGAYWHDKFGQQWSHGCVNLPPEIARTLYTWADIGTTVIVQD